MKPYYILLLLLVGCGEEIIPCHNETIVVNNTIIQYINTTCPEPKTITKKINITVPDPETNKQLISCRMREGLCVEALDICENEGSTDINNDLRHNLSDCKDMIEDFNETIIRLRIKINGSNVSI